MTSDLKAVLKFEMPYVAIAAVGGGLEWFTTGRVLNTLFMFLWVWVLLHLPMIFAVATALIRDLSKRRSNK